MFRHLTSLNKTFIPYQKKECHDLKDKNDMTLINKSQVLFGQAQSYTFWHVENLNMSSINYLHSGKRKYWIM